MTITAINQFSIFTALEVLICKCQTLLLAHPGGLETVFDIYRSILLML